MVISPLVSLRLPSWMRSTSMVRLYSPKYNLWTLPTDLISGSFMALTRGLEWVDGDGSGVWRRRLVAGGRGTMRSAWPRLPP